MALTCKWVKDQTGGLVMKWSIDEAPVRHRRTPHNPGISEGMPRD